MEKKEENLSDSWVVLDEDRDLFLPSSDKNVAGEHRQELTSPLLVDFFVPGLLAALITSCNVYLFLVQEQFKLNGASVFVTIYSLAFSTLGIKSKLIGPSEHLGSWWWWYCAAAIPSWMVSCLHLALFVMEDDMTSFPQLPNTGGFFETFLAAVIVGFVFIIIKLVLFAAVFGGTFWGGVAILMGVGLAKGGRIGRALAVCFFALSIFLVVCSYLD
mmetsp:Transcript_34142/g.58977  ORF Transcript_34142/g.58977 Transcript_34142/m.58977 type:complete len:216 (-) Transcript_34142:103-750(-)